ncbi:hypothetical protein [Lysobacter sp. A03]|uniref:hypothetical protein n=1 Tax=Lysobacter sp. A03 TaxID=1199154 RepID=UPI0005C557AE|nr:hypothetical protein [Lysobacter sp. A03]
MENVLDWLKIAKYAAALFAVQFIIGLFVGLFAPVGGESGVAPLFLGTAASFAFCVAIFTHLAVYQQVNASGHAWAALLVQIAAASALAQILTGWLGKASPVLLALEWLVLVCALIAGTALGSTLRYKGSQAADG